jgi:hypothetical protein
MRRESSIPRVCLEVISFQPRDSKRRTIEGKHKRENIVAPTVRTARANNETRELILRTALPFFAQKGFDGAATARSRPRRT